MALDDAGSLAEDLLSVLSADLQLELVRHVECHKGLAGLACCCRSMRSLLTPALLERRVRDLAGLRGWRAEHLRVPSGVGAGEEAAQPSFLPQPHRWKTSDELGTRRRYAARVRSLPPPHRAWPLGEGRTWRVGGEGADFHTLRAAVASARDGDTLSLACGELDEGARPVQLTRSIRIVGAATDRPSGTTVRGLLVASAGRGAVCGLTLRLPHPTDLLPSAAPPPPPPEGAAAEGGEEDAASGSQRCFAATANCAWVVEDCHVLGGLRAGSTAEMAVVGCRVVGDPTHLAATGVLVQGSSRVLLRACDVQRHLRSGITVQQGGRLWLDHTHVGFNALSGVKVGVRRRAERWTWMRRLPHTFLGCAHKCARRARPLDLGGCAACCTLSWRSQARAEAVEYHTKVVLGSGLAVCD